MPPFEKGLHRSRRQTALRLPLTAPYFLIARTAYWEHEGYNLQVGLPFKGEIYR